MNEAEFREKAAWAHELMETAVPEMKRIIAGQSTEISELMVVVNKLAAVEEFAKYVYGLGCAVVDGDRVTIALRGTTKTDNITLIRHIVRTSSIAWFGTYPEYIRITVAYCIERLPALQAEILDEDLRLKPEYDSQDLSDECRDALREYYHISHCLMSALTVSGLASTLLVDGHVFYMTDEDRVYCLPAKYIGNVCSEPATGSAVTEAPEPVTQEAGPTEVS